MMEETYLMERIKDQMTFTSQNLSEDLAKAKAGVHRLDYVLPDGVSSGTGYIRQHHQTGEKRRSLDSGKEVRPSICL